ncbi:MAG TPA: HepT-like ribonuclease domain-containing protein [Bryobacteraceae bacterium]
MKIVQKSASAFAIFQSDEMLQVWTIHHLQVIGEAARSISESVKKRYPEVPWPQIAALRNILVHEYFGLNLHQLWTMSQTDVPELQKKLESIRDDMHRSGAP